MSSDLIRRLDARNLHASVPLPTMGMPLSFGRLARACMLIGLKAIPSDGDASVGWVACRCKF